MSKHIIYYRVSTNKQFSSHLGLDAQKASVLKFLGDKKVIAEFTEVESGRKDNRPRLAEAIKLAKETGAVLVVARLDRLARSVAFTSTLLDSGVEFVCVDMPSANRMTIQFMSILAENYALSVKTNTRAALAELKQKGVKLGSANPKIKAALIGKQGNYSRPPSSLPNVYSQPLAIIKSLKACGKTYQFIANYLNENGHRSSKGNPFSINLVHRLLKCESTWSKTTSTTLSYQTTPDNFSPASAPCDGQLVA